VAGVGAGALVPLDSVVEGAEATGAELLSAGAGAVLGAFG